MDRSERFYRIQQMLQHRRFVRTQEFLDELEVSRATFKRDLEYLRDRFRAPILYDPEHEAYRFDDKVEDREVWQLPGLWFTADELRALITMDRLLADLEPGVLSELIGPFRKRLKELLGSGEHKAAEVAKRIRVLSMGARTVEPAHFRALSTALLSRRRLRIRHRRRQDGETLERDISPQRLVHYRDNWYLDAFCHKRQALRTFGVDAIESATVLDKDAKDVADEALERHFAAGYGIFAGAETQERARTGDGRAQVRRRRRGARAGVAARGRGGLTLARCRRIPRLTARRRGIFRRNRAICGRPLGRLRCILAACAPRPVAGPATLCEPMCEESHMATNLSLDPALIDEVLALSGEKTKRAAVTRALEEYVARRRQKRLLDLMGKLEWEPGFDYKRERTRR